MSKSPDEFPGKQIELYDRFRDDKEASADLLREIRIYFQQELNDSGFIRHFLDAMGGVDTDDLQARIYVAQTFRAGDDIRIINAVMREQKEGSYLLHTRKVGEEMNSMRMPSRYFTDEDLELAMGQLDSLQKLKDNGMIALDRTLSWPADSVPLFE